ADFGETIDVRLARAEVAALDRVVKKPENAIAVVLIILRRVDSALRRDRVRAPWRILIAKAFHLVAELAERRRRRAACESRADDDDFKFPPIRRVDELRIELVLLPLFFERAAGDFCVEAVCHFKYPIITAIGIET